MEGIVLSPSGCMAASAQPICRQLYIGKANYNGNHKSSSIVAFVPQSWGAIGRYPKAKAGLPGLA
jgi:hypothetical protein